MWATWWWATLAKQAVRWGASVSERPSDRPSHRDASRQPRGRTRGHPSSAWSPPTLEAEAEAADGPRRGQRQQRALAVAGSVDVDGPTPGFATTPARCSRRRAGGATAHCDYWGIR